LPQRQSGIVRTKNMIKGELEEDGIIATEAEDGIVDTWDGSRMSNQQKLEEGECLKDQ